MTWIVPWSFFWTCWRLIKTCWLETCVWYSPFDDGSPAMSAATSTDYCHYRSQIDPELLTDCRFLLRTMNRADEATESNQSPPAAGWVENIVQRRLSVITEPEERHYMQLDSVLVELGGTVWKGPACFCNLSRVFYAPCFEHFFTLIKHKHHTDRS